tara:strand:- start:1287 stop:1700 length:414 start_codon:yes stop_codon:yes gene_type:complete
MVKNSSGEDGYRSFTIVNMTKSDGCPTKFTGGRYVARSPAAAARKALSYHCAVKSIRGRCALYIKVKETTQGSKGKHYIYLAHRVKLDTPIVRFAGQSNEFEVNYLTKVESADAMPKRCRTKGRRKTTGRMRSRRRR